MKEVFYAAFRDGKLLIQESPYIEEGWYVEHHDGLWHLYEVPLCGEERFNGEFLNFEDGLAVARTWT